MRAAEIMTTNVQTVPRTMSADDAWEFMRRKRIRHLVVTDGSRVEGVLSERDAGGRRGEKTRADSNVGDLMTAGAVTISPDTTVRKIANLMRGRTIGCVPVMDGQHLAGIVTVSDLLEVLGRGIDRPVPGPRRGLHHRVPHRKMKRAFGVW
jgi:CBS domain-containing protein